jgi:hypothetical protein
MLLPLLIAGSMLLSTVVIVGLVRGRRRMEGSRDWPTVPGRLLECELCSRPNDDGPGELYHLHAKYFYQFEGEVYEGRTIQFSLGEWGSMREVYDDLHGHLTDSPSLTVYVNPKKPSEAVLFPGTNLHGGHLVVFAVLAVVCPLAAVVAVYVIYLR